MEEAIKKLQGHLHRMAGEFREKVQQTKQSMMEE